MPILVAGSVTPTPLRPTPNPKAGLQQTWTGWDGTVWDLIAGTQGVRLVAGAVRGMNMPTPQHYRSEAPAVAGSRYRGTRVGQREVFWPLLTERFDQTPQAWVELDRAFWRTLDPTRLGTWTVTEPAGSARALDLRFEDVDDGFTQDPTYAGYAAYAVTLVAEQPYWRGQTITRTFTNAPAVEFFGPPGIINISSGSDVASAKITNAGDVPGWVTWTIRGPVDSGSVGLTGAQIPLPAVADGETLVIYTQPDLMIALLDGVEVELDPTSKFKAIPAGGATVLAITLTATLPGGSIEASLSPYFYRAF